MRPTTILEKVASTFQKQSTAPRAMGLGSPGVAFPPSRATPNRPAHLQKPSFPLSTAMIAMERICTHSDSARC